MRGGWLSNPDLIQYTVQYQEYLGTYLSTQANGKEPSRSISEASKQSIHLMLIDIAADTPTTVVQ